MKESELPHLATGEMRASICKVLEARSKHIARVEAFGRWAWKEVLRAARTLRLRKVKPLPGALSISQREDGDSAIRQDVVRGTLKLLHMLR